VSNSNIFRALSPIKSFDTPFLCTSSSHVWTLYFFPVGVSPISRSIASTNLSSTFVNKLYKTYNYLPVLNKALHLFPLDDQYLIHSTFSWNKLPAWNSDLEVISVANTKPFIIFLLSIKITLQVHRCHPIGSHLRKVFFYTLSIQIF